MTFNTGGGAGGGNLSGSGDVAFSNPVGGDVVTFNQTTSKWTNAVSTGNISSHIAAADPHAAAKYAVMVDGGRQILTRTTDPANDSGLTVSNGDIWLAL